jgi:hypothetical protein
LVRRRSWVRFPPWAHTTLGSTTLGSSLLLPSWSRVAVRQFVHRLSPTQINHLLAIGPERLQAADRLALSIPVYVGDSVQWGQARDLLSANMLSIPTALAYRFMTEAYRA